MEPAIDRGKNFTSSHDGKVRMEWQNNRMLFAGNDGQNSLLVGPRLDGQLAVELATQGVNVLTASDDQLVFSSRFKSFKIADSDVIQFNSPNLIGSTTFKNVTHSVSYPIVWAFVSFAPMGTVFPLPYNDIEGIGANAGKVKFKVSYETVGSNITFYYSDITAATSNTAYIRYYLLVETAATT